MYGCRLDRFQKFQLPKLAQLVDFPMVPMFVTRVASDSLTAVALCLLLNRSRTGYQNSDTMVKMLINYAINRFLLTTVVVIVQVIVLLVKPQSIWAMVIEFVSATLYVNSLLATLNSRNHVRNISEGGSSSTSPYNIRVAVNRSTERTLDFGRTSDTLKGQRNTMMQTLELHSDLPEDGKSATSTAC